VDKINEYIYLLNFLIFDVFKKPCNKRPKLYHFLSAKSKLRKLSILEVFRIKKLIINADDLGLHRKINEAIFAAHRNGCVTSTTIIAGGQAFDHAVMLARQCPDLGIGLHLTLIGGLRRWLMKKTFTLYLQMKVSSLRII
jgi:hypothetical protein